MVDSTTTPGWVECYAQFESGSLKGSWYQCSSGRWTIDGKWEITLGPVVFSDKETDTDV
jgi:hypothetical protein